jgi:hypothetical protein
MGGSGVEKGGVVAIHFNRGLPGWAEPQERPRSRRETYSDHTIMRPITIYLGLDVHKDSITIAGWLLPEVNWVQSQSIGSNFTVY